MKASKKVFILAGYLALGIMRRAKLRTNTLTQIGQNIWGRKYTRLTTFQLHYFGPKIQTRLLWWTLTASLQSKQHQKRLENFQSAHQTLPSVRLGRWRYNLSTEFQRRTFESGPHQSEFY